MRERYVTDPAGTAWIVGPVLPLGVPRYRGFRFGVARRDRIVVGAGPDADAPGAQVPPQQRRSVRRGSSWPVVLPRLPRSRRSGGGSARSGGEASGRRGGEGSGERGGTGAGARGGGAVGVVGGIGALLLTIGKWVLIVLGIAAATALTVFVLLPGLAYLVELAVVGALVAWRALTKRPWTLRAREDRDAPTTLDWPVASGAALDRAGAEVSAALATGTPLRPGSALAD